MDEAGAHRGGLAGTSAGAYHGRAGRARDLRLDVPGMGDIRLRRRAIGRRAPSRRGMALTRRFFDTNDSSPVTILLVRDEPFASDEELRKASDKMSDSLYLDGVSSVRSVNDPLGDYPPHRSMGFLNTDAWRRRVLKEHRISKDRYLSPVDAYHGRLAKFEVVLTDNPFSLDATATLERLSNAVEAETDRIGSPWYQAKFTTVGTTVGITDLRDVTQSDQSRIQILVTLACGVDGAIVFAAAIYPVDVFDLYGAVQLFLHAGVNLRLFRLAVWT